MLLPTKQTIQDNMPFTLQSLSSWRLISLRSGVYLGSIAEQLRYVICAHQSGYSSPLRETEHPWRTSIPHDHTGAPGNGQGDKTSHLGKAHQSVLCSLLLRTAMHPIPHSLASTKHSALHQESLRVVAFVYASAVAEGSQRALH